MGVEDEKVGEAAGTEETAEKPDKLSALEAQLAAMAEQQKATNAQLAQVTNFFTEASKPPPPKEDEPDPGLLDAEMQKALASTERRVASMVNGVADQQDYMHFQGAVNQLGADNEDAKAALQLHNSWIQGGAKFNGKPPMRIDALTYVMGQKAIHGQAKSRSDAEASRRVEAEDADMPRGGGRSPVDVKRFGDPEKMTREDRLKPGGYYDKRLGDVEF